ncbi:MBL fold metallo-hydrolase [Celerinatantimonas sp. YJH-8]|uniref:MBL fold metallo-hydrolase n=1 Tax=Celerinatantimonas sp. YJH-8 TaxID=3228714 RepID=UPI0038C11013
MSFTIIPVTSFSQNCSLIWCDQTRQAAWVDPGGEANRLIQTATEHNVQITKILLTHGHLDHVGAALELANHYEVEIIGPQIADQFWLDHLPEQSQMFGLAHCEAFIPHHWLSHGDMVTIGEQELEVRHCPGHTPGHIVFINHQQRLAWVGDVLFHGGIGRTDFPQGNYEALIHSIKNELLTLPDDYQFIPGHGPSSTIGNERTRNPFLKG